MCYSFCLLRVPITTKTVIKILGVMARFSILVTFSCTLNLVLDLQNKLYISVQRQPPPSFDRMNVCRQFQPKHSGNLKVCSLVNAWCRIQEMAY